MRQPSQDYNSGLRCPRGRHKKECDASVAECVKYDEQYCGGHRGRGSTADCMCSGAPLLRHLLQRYRSWMLAATRHICVSAAESGLQQWTQVSKRRHKKECDASVAECVKCDGQYCGGHRGQGGTADCMCSGAPSGDANVPAPRSTIRDRCGYVLHTTWHHN